MKKQSQKAKQRQKRQNRKGKKERNKNRMVIREIDGRLYEESEGFSDLANADELRDQLDQYIQQFREKQK